MIYAIDYGTSNSLLAAVKDGKSVDPIPLDRDNADPTVFRSLMFFPNEGGAVFGKAAIRAYDEKRAEGRLFRSVKKFLPIQSFRGTMMGSDFYELSELIGRFLREMKSRADTYFDQNVDSVILGRPARFSLNDEDDRLAQERLERAARFAGFKHIEFYPEPLAAAHEFRKHLTEEKMVLVVDLGGGTSDFTVLKLGPKPFKPSDVLAVGGTPVAGDALDSSIMTGKIAPYFGSEAKYRLPLSSNILTMPADIKYKLGSPPDIALMTKVEVMSFLKSVQKAALNDTDKQKIDRLFTLIEDNLGFRIYESIETLKRDVCQGLKAIFDFPYPDIEIKTEFTPDEFHQMSAANIAKIFASMDETVKAAGVENSDIDLVCCTGGTAKVPEITRGLEARFGKATIEQFKNFHSVIQGLAEKAKSLT
ncbi:MAG: Hsp70 family protein [Bdellovibrionales bacterium]